MDIMSSITILLSLFLLFFRHSNADDNFLWGSSCSHPSEAKSGTWMTNLNNLFSALETNVTLNNGYGIAEVGEKGPDKVYGLIQCRGDISMSNCADCTRNSFKSNSSCGDDEGTRRHRRVLVYQRWCLMRYSNESFFGVWEKSIHIVTSNRSFSEEQPAVAAKGRMMMMGLAAAAPGEGLIVRNFIVHTYEFPRTNMLESTRIKHKHKHGSVPYITESNLRISTGFGTGLPENPQFLNYLSNDGF